MVYVQLTYYIIHVFVHGVLYLLLFRVQMIIIYLRTNNEQNIMNTRHIRLHISPMTGIMTCYDKISIEINGNLISSKNFPTSTNTLRRNSLSFEGEMPRACSVLACGIAVACNSASTPGGTARDAAGARPDIASQESRSLKIHM